MKSLRELRRLKSRDYMKNTELLRTAILKSTASIAVLARRLASCVQSVAERRKEIIMDVIFISDRDTDTERVCGTCGLLKPVSEFYKDGKYSNGKIRYRRDCKECYKKARLTGGGKHDN